jgi:hypothetical protein
MNNPTVIFDPYASADLRNIVQTILDNHNVAITGEAEWYPVAFFLRDDNGEVLGGLLGNIWRLGYRSESWPWSALREDVASARN